LEDAETNAIEGVYVNLTCDLDEFGFENNLEPSIINRLKGLCGTLMKEDGVTELNIEEIEDLEKEKEEQPTKGTLFDEQNAVLN
jgi:hypothetical protein